MLRCKDMLKKIILEGVQELGEGVYGQFEYKHLRLLSVTSVKELKKETAKAFAEVLSLHSPGESGNSGEISVRITGSGAGAHVPPQCQSQVRNITD